MFTDRDGKSQLMSLSESSFDPLSRTTRFMLTEEAHHMFVGETGIARILERTSELLKESGYSEDVRKLGGIDLPTIQKHVNLWVSLSLDLHGGEVSSNAASYFANGLKGRAQEARDLHGPEGDRRDRGDDRARQAEPGHVTHVRRAEGGGPVAQQERHDGIGGGERGEVGPGRGRAGHGPGLWQAARDEGGDAGEGEEGDDERPDEDRRPIGPRRPGGGTQDPRLRREDAGDEPGADDEREREKHADRHEPD